MARRQGTFICRRGKLICRQGTFIRCVASLLRLSAGMIHLHAARKITRAVLRQAHIQRIARLRPCRPMGSPVWSLVGHFVLRRIGDFT